MEAKTKEYTKEEIVKIYLDQVGAGLPDYRTATLRAMEFYSSALSERVREQDKLLNDYENDVGKLKVQRAGLEDRVRELTEENERLVHALENSSRELYALMSHCVDQNFIDPEEETDGYKDYERSIQLSTSVLSKARKEQP